MYFVPNFWKKFSILASASNYAFISLGYNNNVLI